MWILKPNKTASINAINFSDKSPNSGKIQKGSIQKNNQRSTGQTGLPNHCIVCKSNQHSHLMFCKDLPQYVYGTSPPPRALSSAVCKICLTTNPELAKTKCKNHGPAILKAVCESGNMKEFVIVIIGDTSYKSYNKWLGGFVMLSK